MILLAARIVNSAIGAASRPASGAYVADVTSEEDRSAGMGKFGAANNIGTILGPVLVGSLVGLNIFDIQIPQFGLLTPLIVMSIVMAMAAIFVYIFLPKSKLWVADVVSYIIRLKYLTLESRKLISEASPHLK